MSIELVFFAVIIKHRARAVLLWYPCVLTPQNDFTCTKLGYHIQTRERADPTKSPQKRSKRHKNSILAVFVPSVAKPSIICNSLQPDFYFLHTTPSEPRAHLKCGTQCLRLRRDRLLDCTLLATPCWRRRRQAGSIALDSARTRTRLNSSNSATCGHVAR